MGTAFFRFQVLVNRCFVESWFYEAQVFPNHGLTHGKQQQSKPYHF